MTQAKENVGGSPFHGPILLVCLAGDRTLSECFKLFDIIHRLTTDHATITRITQEVIEDFAADNVLYLELRTTPKVSLSLLSSSVSGHA